MRPDQAPLVDRLHDALPQTQCTRCGFPDCRAYAQAIADGQADINQCPPGGAQGIVRLAAITGAPVLALNTSHGIEATRAVAVIDENWCIGCTLCQPVCPTDAIVGSNKLMHTVIESHCTGCQLCVPACPVDCIEMVEVTQTTGWSAWSSDQANEARQRYEAHQARIARNQTEKSKRLDKVVQDKLKDLASHSQITDADELERKRSLIEAALEKARTRRKNSIG
jgi:electron transport complex protein RnfB